MHLGHNEGLTGELCSCQTEVGQSAFTSNLDINSMIAQANMYHTRIRWHQ